LSVRIGIPSGLLYFEHGTFWEDFFRELGAEVIKSGPTNREILDKGIEYCVSEACLPVKIYHGHVLQLADRVDYIFIPRYISMSPGKYICPKIGGLPDLVRNSLEGLPPIIDAEVNLYRRLSHFFNAAVAAGFHISRNKTFIKQAFKKALDKYTSSQEQYSSSCQQQKLSNGRPRIGVLGHPYILRDRFINMNLIEKLQGMGIAVFTPDMINPPLLRDRGDLLPKKLFWEYGSRAVGFGRIMAGEGIDGLLYISSFGCGVDAFVSEIVSREAKEWNLPFSLINIDEHTGEAGLDTRLEAFADMILRRSPVNENNLSTYG